MILCVLTLGGGKFATDPAKIELDGFDLCFCAIRASHLCFVTALDFLQVSFHSLSEDAVLHGVQGLFRYVDLTLDYDNDKNTPGLPPRRLDVY